MNTGCHGRGCPTKSYYLEELQNCYMNANASERVHMEISRLMKFVNAQPESRHSGTICWKLMYRNLFGKFWFTFLGLFCVFWWAIKTLGELRYSVFVLNLVDFVYGWKRFLAYTRIEGIINRIYLTHNNQFQSRISVGDLILEGWSQIPDCYMEMELLM